MKLTSSQIFMTIVSMVGIVAIGLGLALIDTPSLVRLKKLDEEKIKDLDRLTLQIKLYYKSKKILPTNFDQLDLVGDSLKEHVTQNLYSYKIVGADSYMLCAVFGATVTPQDNNPFYNMDSICGIPHQHNAGKQCYTLSAKPCS